MVQTVVEKGAIKYGSFKNLDQSERLELPLVSIIMPAYNAASTIAESILSVLSQTYINWELLIVDDCSSDNTAELARHYQEIDSRIHFFQTPDNSGVAKARNMAIHEAGGRFISFLDSDDIWYPEKLSHQVWFLLENES
jgi:glycosyltransferase involved in cell wall biosynthesis